MVFVCCVVTPNTLLAMEINLRSNYCEEKTNYCVLHALGRDDFQFFWNFITAIQILPCVIETQRYGYIRDSGGRVETPHGATIGCEKSYNG